MANTSVVNEHQPSLSEWLEAIGHARSAALREEDMGKRKRLEVLRQLIGIDYDHVWTFPAVDFFDRVPDVEAFLQERGNDLCALRLVPNDPRLPKFRTRGRSINESLPWLHEQPGIDPVQYQVEVVEHSGKGRRSTIFIVREDGIFGEVVDGLHYQLTQGNKEEGKMGRAFARKPDGVWQWSDFDEETHVHMNEILSQLLVKDASVQERIHEALGSTFTKEGHLMGYFETVLWPTKLIFIDYNRMLHEMLPPMWIVKNEGGVIAGVPASEGEAEGVVRIVESEGIESAEFHDGNILVTDNTDVRFLPLMRRAGAIVTDRGGMLSHAAIVARELKIPAVVGTKDASKRLKNGDRVRVNATKGTIEIL